MFITYVYMYQAVSSKDDDNYGAVFVMFMSSAGVVLSSSKIMNGK